MRKGVRAESRRDALAAAGFLLPFMLVYLAFMAYPIIRGAVTSLMSATAIDPGQFIGLANFIAMFAAAHTPDGDHELAGWDLELIPYSRWANRGASTMRVWLPKQAGEPSTR